MYIDAMKFIAVVNGALPQTSSVGWRFVGDNKITRYFIVFRPDGEPVQAKDGSCKLNSHTYDL
jgi:hypothetical protein